MILLLHTISGQVLDQRNIMNKCHINAHILNMGTLPLSCFTPLPLGTRTWELSFIVSLVLSRRRQKIKKNKMRLYYFVCSLLLLITFSTKFNEISSLRRDMTKLLEIQEKIQERLAVTPSLPPLSSPSSPFPKMVKHYPHFQYVYTRTCECIL